MDGGAIAGEGGYQQVGEANDTVCPHCGEGTAPYLPVCEHCGEALPDDGQMDPEFAETLASDGPSGEWSGVGVQLVGYAAALALVVMALATTLGPALWRWCAPPGAGTG